MWAHCGGIPQLPARALLGAPVGSRINTRDDKLAAVDDKNTHELGPMEQNKEKEESLPKRTNSSNPLRII